MYACTCPIDDSEGDTLIRFKDATACIGSLRNYVKLRVRCLITRGIYAQAKYSDLSLDNETDWNVRSCKLKFSFDQVSSGLTTLDGVSDEWGRALATRIPREELPAPIETVIKYCCKNVCFNCNGARLHGDIQVYGFVPIPKGKGYMIPLNQYKQPKPDPCEWRLSKRRERDQDTGQFLPIGDMHTNIHAQLLSHFLYMMHLLGWLGRCVECSEKQKIVYTKCNELAKEKRHRIKEHEHEFENCEKTVQITSHDLIA